MKLILFALAITMATCLPTYNDESDEIKILKDERYHPHDGKYSFDVETENGIVWSESGSPLDVDGYPTGQQGEYSFVFPNGEKFTMKYVANENGFHPESPYLPVAPEFPHPIPQFVLDQIEKARLEDLRGGDDSDEGQRSYGYN